MTDRPMATCARANKVDAPQRRPTGDQAAGRGQVLRRGAARGFGLLEAIVALTLLAGTGMVLFAWIHQSQDALRRSQRAEHRARLQLEATELLQTFNPAEKERGQLEQAGMRLEWTAELLEPARPNATFVPPEAGPWLLSLYRVKVSAQSLEDVDMRVDFEQVLVGRRRVRPVVSGGGL